MKTKLSILLLLLLSLLPVPAGDWAYFDIFNTQQFVTAPNFFQAWSAISGLTSGNFAAVQYWPDGTPQNGYAAFGETPMFELISMNGNTAWQFNVTHEFSYGETYATLEDAYNAAMTTPYVPADVPSLASIQASMANGLAGGDGSPVPFVPPGGDTGGGTGDNGGGSGSSGGFWLDLVNGSLSPMVYTVLGIVATAVAAFLGFRLVKWLRR